MLRKICIFTTKKLAKTNFASLNFDFAKFKVDTKEGMFEVLQKYLSDEENEKIHKELKDQLSIKNLYNTT